MKRTQQALCKGALVAIIMGLFFSGVHVHAATAYSLTVTKNGSGSGAVTSEPAGINCGGTCTALFAKKTKVTLTAIPDAGSTFTKWSGKCRGTKPTCTVKMSRALSVGAIFTAATSTAPVFLLTVTKSGTGSGMVTSSPVGITCGETCRASFAKNTAVTLTATSSAGSTFTGWSGDCSGLSKTCVVTMDAAKSAGATFTLDKLSLTDNLYFYDPLGRLIRMIQSNGQVTTYDYDPVGNLRGMTVRTSTGLGPPIISAILPPSIRTGGSRSILIRGSNFLGGYLTTDNPEIDVDSQITDTDIHASFFVPYGARLGTTTVRVSTSLGDGTGAIQILSSLLQVSPLQLTINKGTSSALTLSLADPSPDPIIVTLTSSNPGIASLPGQVTINPGATSTSTPINGISAGFAAIQARTGDDLPIEVLVQVAAPFAGSAIAASSSGVSVFYPHFTGSGIAATPSGVSVFYPHFTGSGIAATASGVSVFYPHFTGSGIAATPSGVSVFYPHFTGSGIAATPSGVSVFYPHFTGSGIAATQQPVSVKFGP